MIAVGITAVCTATLTAFAFQTKIDFTMSSGVLMCALTCLILMGFLMFFIKSKVRGVALLEKRSFMPRGGPSQAGLRFC
jgi:FtsH-binding integral membrane protein